MGRCEAPRALPAALLAALLLAPAGCADPVLSPGDRDRWRDGARAIGRWLESNEVATDHGVKWPVVPGAEPPVFETNLYAGACGPTLFFLRLAADSRGDEREHALARARAGADELLAALPAKCEGAACGLYTGIAGIGFTLEETGRATGEPRFRDGARRCVRLLHASAQLAGSGVEWSDVTDVIAGSAGIGGFLLGMHEREGDGVALDLATRAGRRLLDLAQREAVGRSWRMDPTFPRVMPNFSHGTAGIVWFLARLHEATGLPEFLTAARDGADHLLSIADRSGEGCRIGHHSPDGTDLYYLGWCHGPCGTGRAFDLLARLTGDPRYADAVRGCTRSLVASGLPKELAPGFWNNVGVCCGSAGVIEFLLERARATGDVALVARAQEFADDLLARGTRDETGLRFVHAEHRVKPELLEAQTSWMQGAAGIGVALLDLAAFGDSDGEAARIVLPDGSTGRR